MLKPVRIGIALWLLMGVNQLIYAGAGSLFDVTATGAASTVSIRLCLNGKGALSCQDETVSALTLTISPSIRNHVYPAMGIKINTPGYGISGLGLTCTPNSNGYCLFSASQSQPKSLMLVAFGETIPVVAVGANTNVPGFSIVPLSDTSLNNGVTWTASTTPPPIGSGSGGLNGVACSNGGDICTAVGTDGNNSYPISYTSTDGGVTWIASVTQPPVAVSGRSFLIDVACSRVGTVCAAIGIDTNNDTPYSCISSDGGINWALSTTQPPTNASGQGFLLGIACSSNGLVCTTVGTDGDLIPISYTSSDGGVTWLASITQPPVNGSGGGQLYGVACSNNGLSCTAVGNDGNGLPLSYISSDGGVTWMASTTQPPVNSSGQGYLYGVACATNGMMCTAVGSELYGAPISYISSDGGVTWRASTTPPPVNGSASGFLARVVCSANGLTCTAVGYDGNQVPLSYTTLDGGDTWVASTTQPPLVDSVSTTGSLSAVARIN